MGRVYIRTSKGQSYDYKAYYGMTYDVVESNTNWTIFKRTPISPGASATTAETVVQIPKGVVPEVRKL